MPSQMPDAEAGVTTPSFLKVVGSLPSFSSVVDGFGCSSVSKTTLPLRDLSSRGAISGAKAPAWRAK